MRVTVGVRRDDEGITFWGQPQQCWGENVQNSPRFLTIFDFDRKSRCNGST